ncbi:PTS glucose transporter subunit IIABC [Clostridia bacterium]|nr:PTS glucose transporter subunit IIABC [Clostridia bacterium]
MLPIALLPVAGLLLGLGGSFTNESMIEAYNLQNVLGEGTALNAVLTVMREAGDVIFGNLPILFAMGIALGMAKKEKEVATLAAAVGFFVMHASIAAMVKIAVAGGKVFKDGQLASVVGLNSLQMGVFGGIVVGLGVAALHNRYYKKELPPALSFFGGTRFVPIVVTVAYVFVGILMYFIWPVFQQGIALIGEGMQSAGLVGTLIFGLIKRALIPFGLHHVFYMPFWYTEIGGVFPVKEMVDGAVQTVNVAGGQKAFFAELANMQLITHFNSDATQYFSGEFIFMMFGLPGAALAMYKCAKPEKKAVVGGLLLSAALTSFFTGITEPIEFTFLFVAPVLFVIHVILGGLAYMIAHALNVGVGLTFSGGLIDLALFGILPGNSKTSWIWIPIIGAIYFVLYYGIFTFLIKKLDLKTPGREEGDGEVKLFTKDDYRGRESGGAVSENKGDELSAIITIGLGGKANISDVDCCATRLRVTVKNENLVKQEILKGQTGASGVVCKGTGIQVIFGPRVTIVKSNLEDYLESPASDSPVIVSLKEEPKPAAAPSAAFTGNISSPLEGELIPLSEVPDDVFAGEILGKGAAVIPTVGVVKAPFDGTVTSVAETSHAIGITSDDGVEVLIHVGVDTVKLGGKGFSIKVKEDDKIKKGDILNEFDIALIKEAGYPVVTPVIITNTDDYTDVSNLPKGSVTFGQDIIEIK